MYILKLTAWSTKKFKLKLLIFLIPITITLYVFALFIFPDRVASIYLLNSPEIISIISTIAGVLVALLATTIYSKEESSLRSEFENTKHDLNLNYLKNNWAKSDYSKSELLKIESAVTRLFFISQNEVPSTINALNILKKANSLLICCI